MIRLNDLGKDPGRAKSRKRRGRGEASGLGKTSGYGHKGSQARSGRGKGYNSGFEGGQMPLKRRLPKFGFTSRNRQRIDIINVSDLNTFADGTTVDIAALKAAGKVRGSAAIVKVLGNGTLERKLTVTVSTASASARAAIEGKGGSLTVDSADSQQA